MNLFVCLSKEEKGWRLQGLCLCMGIAGALGTLFIPGSHLHGNTTNTRHSHTCLIYTIHFNQTPRIQAGQLSSLCLFSCTGREGTKLVKAFSISDVWATRQWKGRSMCTEVDIYIGASISSEEVSSNRSPSFAFSEFGSQSAACTAHLLLMSASRQVRSRSVTFLIHFYTPINKGTYTQPCSKRI